MRRLGRIWTPDDQDLNHPLKSKQVDLGFTPEVDDLERQRKLWASRAARLDQGQTGTCVGHGWTHYIRNGPIRQDTGLTPFELYRRMVLIDEWAANDVEAQFADHALTFGTSVRAGAKVLQNLGFIGEYGWTFSAEPALEWIYSQSGVVGGFNWYRGMETTDENGYVWPTGGILGGHCVWGFGVNGDGDTWWLNSWGAWGRRGQGTFKMTYETLDRLIKEDGEVCAAIEVKKAA